MVGFSTYTHIPADLLPGTWENSKYGTFTFNENGSGVFVDRQGKHSKKLKYENEDSWFLVKVDGEEGERTFYLRKNDRTIYELITENNRWKSRRNDYRKKE